MRLKIIAGNLVAVLLLGLVSYAVVSGDLKQQLAGRVLGQIGNDQVLLDRSLRLSGLEFVNLVKQRASDADVLAVFGALDESQRRTRAFEAADRTAVWIGDPARGGRGNPELVVIADDSGKVLARNADRNRMYGMKLDAALPAARSTLQDGEARHDVWIKADEAKLLELGVAPIRGTGGQIAGVLLVGYDLSNGLAASEGKRLGGRDVAFIVDDKVYSSSASDQLAKDLRSYLFGPAKAATEAAKNGQVSSTWVATLVGSEYAGVLAPLPGTSAKVAYAVLNNRTGAASIVGDATKIMLALTLVFSLVVIAYGFMLGNSIVRPIEEIEEGVLAVINGNTDLRLETNNPELGGLAYRINQLLNVFTGVSESPDDDEQGGVAGGSQQDWKDSAFTDGQPGAGAAANPSEPIEDAVLAAKLSSEPEEAYYKRVFAEYVAAKQAVGETINIPEERFTQRLKGNEQALTKKHGKGVRFVVQRNGNQVVLQPVLLT